MVDLYEQEDQTSKSSPKYHLQWDNADNNVRYCKLVKEKLADVQLPDLNQDNAEDVIMQLLDKITEILHTCAQLAGCAIPKRNTFKSWWCPHLSQLRDRKKFWWNIWVCNGRPREGIIYNCYKGVKRLFRKYARTYSQSKVDNHYDKLDGLFHNRCQSSFWSLLKKEQSSSTASSLAAEHFATYYSGIMTDDMDLTPQQEHITRLVVDYSRQCEAHNHETSITSSQVSDHIKLLKKGCSPGIDGVTSEHLYYANSEALCHYLQVVLTASLKYTIVPHQFSTGIIVPVLKKPTLNPNQVQNYRPITISSTYSKLMELCLIPSVDIANTQFGFQERRGTEFACGLLSDIICFTKEKGSPMFMCSLDAEKCFDKIWHDGLFFKLMNILPPAHWAFLYKLYKNLNTEVRWNGAKSEQFRVTRGTRQGSILSPTLFNIYIDELLQKLSLIDAGVCLGGQKYNSFAYADDISLFSLTSTGLQELINCCTSFAEEWRLTFGVTKSKCMVIGKPILCQEPNFYLGDHHMTNAETLDILGVSFNKSGSADTHVNNRLSSARRRFYKAISQGVSYPGLCSDTKAYLWNTWVAPVMAI
jgi:hypothetical protein